MRFQCKYMALRVDLQDAPAETILGCLDAAATHMECVSGLTCDEYYGWWNENVDPFACSTAQAAEETACEDTNLLFGY